MFDSVEQFLRKIEEATGRKLPRTAPNPDDPDDCPICRALGMAHGPVTGVTDLGGTKVVTVRLDENGFPEVDPAELLEPAPAARPGGRARRGRTPKRS